MSLEGNGPVLGGEQQAKQISSFGDKRRFGYWILRRMLRLPEGTLVTLALLLAYGRTDIGLYRLSENPLTHEVTVLLDF
jgi:hypothetical protein